jgi:choline dehydrogenase
LPLKIEFGLLRNPKDIEKLADCVELACRIAATKPFSDCLNEEISPGPKVRSREEIKSFLRERVQTYLHMTAFAPMGLGDDPRAVVDENGKVDVSTTILIAENVADRIKAASS